MSVKNPYEAWAQQEHATEFSSWDSLPTSKFMRLCNQFNECQLAQELAQRTEIHNIWDVGCATGRFYRFFQKTFPGADYRGFDLSVAAIEYAKQRYTDGEFNHFDGNLSEISPGKPDLIFCRDVVLHQPDPVDFLAKLYQAAGQYLVIRVRSRETGATVFDIEQSCQYAHGYWVPYIVFNTEELINMISSYSHAPAKIEVIRHPVILGGQLNRFLPKELYYPETGTAETSILIEKGSEENRRDTEVIIETRPEQRGQERSGLSRLIRRLASR